MKVYRLGPRGRINLELHEEDVPKPQRGEVVVRVRAVSLNYRDLAMVYGYFFHDAPDGLIPMADAAGEVVDVGDGVTTLAVGDRVMNVFNPRWFGGPYPLDTDAYEYGTAQDGWLTEYKVVSEEGVVLVPSNLSYEEAATLPCAAVTAWTALTGPNPVTASDTVLVQGTGGVSLFALQLSKVIGARVIATTSSEDKAARLRDLGADDVVNYRLVPDWGRRVRDLTGGVGVDRIVEVGGSATFRQSLLAGNDRTEIDVIGFLGSQDWEVGFNDLFTGGFETIRRIRVGSREDTRSLTALLERHPITPVIDTTFAFDETPKAWAYLDQGQNFGKIVISA